MKIRTLFLFYHAWFISYAKKTSRLIRDVSREAVPCFIRVFCKKFSLMDFFFAYEFSMYIEYFNRLYLLCNCLLIPFYNNIGQSFWKKKLIFSQFACIGYEVVIWSCGRVSNIYCFTCPHMKVILIRAREKWQNFRWCSVFTTFEQGGIFIVPHVSEHRTSVLRFQLKKNPAPIQSPSTTCKRYSRPV